MKETRPPPERSTNRLLSALPSDVLQRLQKLSVPFGTKIAIEGNIGVIRLPAPTTSTPQ